MRCASGSRRVVVHLCCSGIISAGGPDVLRAAAHGVWLGQVPPHQVDQRVVERVCLAAPPYLCHVGSESLGAVKRGKLAGLEGEMLKKMEPFSLTAKATCLDEITLATVIDKVGHG